MDQRLLRIRVYAALIIGFAALFVLSLAIGPVSMAPAEALAALTGGGDEVARIIVQEIRLPRTILAATIGATLGLGGAALQGLLRNPLAEPGLIGTSNAAALGAVIVIYYGLARSWPPALPAAAVAGALSALFLVLGLAGRRSGVMSLILAGLAVSMLASSLIALALSLSPNYFATLEITFWLLGSLADRSMQHVGMAVPLMVLGWALLVWDRRGLDGLSLGEDTAQSLGVSVSAVRYRLVTGLALSVGAAVAVSGAIGFIGLIVPHIVRPWVGFQPSKVLLPAGLLGAVMLTAADILVRVIPTAQELNLGVVTALLGVPFFLNLLIRARQRFE